MYFLFSKLLLIFILPLTWIVLLLLAGLLVKKPKLKRRLLIAATVLLIVFSNRTILGWYTNIWDIKPQPLPAGKVYSAAIVLGGYAHEDKAGKGYFGPSSNRFIQAVKLKNTGRVNYLMITGGNAGIHPTAFREGAWVAGELPYYGVPSNAILVDQDSRNTLENALYTKRVLDSAKVKPPYLLVTSVYHMRRSQYIFKKVGLDIVPYACDFNADSELSWDDLLPDAAILNVWNLYVKELVGFVVAHFQSVPG